MVRPKQEIITFKADKTLLEALRGVANRSEFIRSALMAALSGACPLCKGTGVLTPKQRDHWIAFSRDHFIEECKECQELHVVCSRPSKRRTRVHRRSTSKRQAR